MKPAIKKRLPLIIIGIGILVTVLIFALKPKVSRGRPAAKPTTIEVVEATSATEESVVNATGLVVPSQQVTLVAQVSGKVISQSKDLMPGGRFKKGQTIFQIDPRDYRLALAEKQSAVRQAEVDLQLETGKQDIVKKEWELLGDDRPIEQAQLALRKPQLAAAQENLKAAKSALEKAQLDLSRTTLRAPFNAMILEENVDVGQLITSTTAAATIIGTDRFWIQASVPVDQIRNIAIPKFNADTGSKVRITQKIANGNDVVREGQVIGVSGGLDSLSKMAQVLVAIENPLDPTDGEEPLLNGSFVSMEIYGRPIENVFKVLRSNVIDGNKVWIVDQKDRIRSRKLTIGWEDGDSIYVTDGLQEGERIMATKLSNPLEGMKVVIGGKQKQNLEKTETQD